MKIPYTHILKKIKGSPSIDEISNRLFQLGHEHEVINNLFDIEFTPNRGDCLSLRGILRDLSVFYEIDENFDIYNKKINPLNINFDNQANLACPNISFLKIDIENIPKEYYDDLNNYFLDLEEKKINFFTDVANFISYEMGQPLHCYDASKIGGSISLKIIKDTHEFTTLLDKQITLTSKNLVFMTDNRIINLAGIIGSKCSACSDKTKSVLIECAYFNHEDIIGKSVKYDIRSDAAHKFERGADPLCHDYVLRRFLNVVESHTDIIKAELISFNNSNFKHHKIKSDINTISSILGTKLDKKSYQNYLTKLGFKIENNFITVPSHRSDIQGINDIAEEMARAIGYNNIPAKTINLPKNHHYYNQNNFEERIELEIKNILINNGFNEVVNDPFVSSEQKNSIKIDNPLDSNRAFLRTNLKDKLIENMIFNERRQKNSLKLFEFSDLYFKNKDGEIIKKRNIGIICSGIVDKNYRDFTKKINKKYLTNILIKIIPAKCIKFIDISRESLNSKTRNEIVYLELDLNEIENLNLDGIKERKKLSHKFIQYRPISEFPSSSRDLSFSINDPIQYYDLQKFIGEYKNELLKEVFIFDFYQNFEKKEIKIGFRFIFQSDFATITDKEINEIMDIIIQQSLEFDSISIPGLV